ncbi:hypothetical protein EC973_002980 [Apophysomyces ossiformis]|uniref:Adenosine deaminase domain-containing protein n=1 Tax=Apophysomyces ossiformis TaxID=679940 RepID=A0A8H7ES99_9FUNG|nr:hypothetical protein EC973_002980 [Apophysomyces ossiformis]
MEMVDENLTDFCVKLPKVELHAHINGSISSNTMRALVARKPNIHPSLAQFRIPDSMSKLDEFFDLFKFIYQLTDDEESMRIATNHVIDEFAKDGVRYLELRTTPRMTKKSYLAAVLSAVNAHRDNIIVRLIVAIDRRNSLEEAQEAVDLALQFRSQGVVGMDLCGDVLAGSFDELKPAFLRAKAEGFKLTLHFNEVEQNIPEAPSLLSVHPNRLGHATLLDDTLRKTIYDNRIPIEICMSSNIISKTVATFEEHHVKDLLVENHPFVLCTDDKGVFFSDLSNEYFIAAKTFKMTRQQLYEASFQTIDAIFESETIKNQLKNDWLAWREKHQHEF